ncbi:MAG: metalloregulator ArsR/SmtB family transcription factor [Actinomycetota bacterium]|nr:metalloregulator ArsR/SmtB family transcription factor [Actinomycetota bacterium]
MPVKQLPLVDVAACCGGPLTETISRVDAATVAAGFKALADPARIQLLHLVAGAAAQEACVCDLTDSVGLSQGTVSHHLKILTEAGLLIRESRGTWAWYALNPSRVEELKTHLAIG